MTQRIEPGIGPCSLVARGSACLIVVAAVLALTGVATAGPGRTSPWDPGSG
jgi:hypothetical protein